jgi:hypothetical protein
MIDTSGPRPSPDEIIKSLKEQKSTKFAVTAFAGWSSIVALLGLLGGVVLQNRTLALSSLCWLSSGALAVAASKETEERNEIERKIEFVLKASALRKEASAAAGVSVVGRIGLS